MPTHPEILWAQRSSGSDESKNIIYLTVNLPDIHKDTLQYSLNPDKLTFKAVSGKDEEHKKDYAFEIEFYEEIVPEKSVAKTSDRAFDVKIQKKNTKAEYWPRLTKEKNRFVKTNFDRWVDEDEQDGGVPDDDFDFDGSGGGAGPAGMDFEKMMADIQRSQGAGSSSAGAGADEDNDDSSDDEGPPPLEDAEPSKQT